MPTVTAEIPRAEAAAKAAEVPFVVLNERMETQHGHLSIATMHLAKGLEFGAVAVMACDDEVLPLQERIEAVTDESDLEDVYARERPPVRGVHAGAGLSTRQRREAGIGVCGGSWSGEERRMSVEAIAGEPAGANGGSSRR